MYTVFSKLSIVLLITILQLLPGAIQLTQTIHPNCFSIINIPFLKLTTSH